MNKDEQALASHAMTLFAIGAIIKAMQRTTPSFAWSVTEVLSNLQTDQMSSTDATGAEMAKQWVFENFTAGSPTE